MWVMYGHLCNMKLYKNRIIKKLFVPDREGVGYCLFQNRKKNKSSRKMRGGQICYLEFTKNNNFGNPYNPNNLVNEEEFLYFF